MANTIGRVPLKPSIRNKLYNQGYERLDSILGEQVETLSKALEISESEVTLLMKRIQKYSAEAFLGFAQPITAFTLLKTEQSAKRISTGSYQLDTMLGGGLLPGGIFEFSGVPGVGKTQLCIQFCVNVQIPQELNGLQGSAVFIDTEGGFVVNRVKEIALALYDHYKSTHPMDADAVADLAVENILKRIYYFRCHDYLDLVATVHLLPIEIIEKSSPYPVRLIVVDSVASHVRYAFDDMARRSKILNGLMQTLAKCAIEKSIAVVVTNQMTTRIVPGEEGRLVPALGTSWGHSCAVRVNLQWKNDGRVAHLFKSPTQPDCVVPYAVTALGIRDVGFVEPEQQESDKPDDDLERTLLFTSSQFTDTGEDMNVEEYGKFSE